MRDGRAGGAGRSAARRAQSGGVPAARGDRHPQPGRAGAWPSGWPATGCRRSGIRCTARIPRTPPMREAAAAACEVARCGDWFGLARAVEERVRTVTGKYPNVDFYLAPAVPRAEHSAGALHAGVRGGSHCRVGRAHPGAVRRAGADPARAPSTSGRSARSSARSRGAAEAAGRDASSEDVMAFESTVSSAAPAGFATPLLARRRPAGERAAASLAAVDAAAGGALGPAVCRGRFRRKAGRGGGALSVGPRGTGAAGGARQGGRRPRTPDVRRAAGVAAKRARTLGAPAGAFYLAPKAAARSSWARGGPAGRGGPRAGGLAVHRH